MRHSHLLPIVLLAACASNPGGTARTETVRVATNNGGTVQISSVTTDRPLTHTVPAAIEDVWRVLPAVFDSLGIPVTERQQASRTIANTGVRLRRKLGNVSLHQYIDCGNAQGGPNAETYEVFFSFQTQVMAGRDAGSAQLSTLLQPLARPVNFSGDWVRCSSKGVLEAKIADVTKAKLGK